jgi:transposase InsO family protein
VQGTPIIALIDTGSEVTAMSEAMYLHLLSKKLKFPIFPVIGISILGATSKRSKRITTQIFLSFNVDSVITEIPCLIVPELIKDVILGIDWLTTQKVILDFVTATVKIDDTIITPERIQMPINQIHQIHSTQLRIDRAETDKDDTEANNREHPDINSLLTSQVTDNELINESQKAALHEILTTHASVFSTKPGKVNCYEHNIEVTDSQYFCQKSYPVPFAHKPAVEAELNRMLNLGIIERASSPYLNPLVAVHKRDGSVRLCLDAKQLNKILVPEREFPASPDEILQKFEGVKWLTSLDLVSSFWQIPLTDNSKKFTAFKFDNKIYQFKVLPFGLSTSTASFTKCLDIVLTDAVKSFTTTYVDDILITSNNFEEHIAHIDTVLNLLSAANMTVKLSKSLFCKDKLPFLGFVLSKDGLSPDIRKLNTIRDWPIPRNQRQLRAFLGICSFYRRFSSIYSSKTIELQYLLKKKVKWKWTPELTCAFEEVKSLFIDTVHLAYPDYSKRFYLNCDASNFGIGSQIFQYDDNNEKQVVSMASRMLQGAELNYTVTEKELLSIVWSLQKFYIFLRGAEFTIVVDHHALLFIRQCKLLSGRIKRWSLWLAQFQFNIEHCPGKDNTVPDILNRFPERQDKDEIGFDKNDREVIIAVIDKSINTLRKELKDIATLQRLDPTFGEIIEALQLGKDHPKKHSYTLKQDRLYHKHAIPNKHTTWQLCLPIDMARKVITAIHIEIGHFGPAKCLYVMQEHFYCQSLARKIRQTLACCDSCQRNKHSPVSSHGTYAPILPTTTSQLICTDLYGPLPAGIAGAKYILVYLDMFSKLVTLYTLPKATADRVTTKLKHYVANIHKPTAILHDHGSQYTSKTYTDKLHELGIKAYYSSIRHPQSNPAERIMRELGRMFRTYCAGKHNSWVKYVPFIETCFNSTYHASTGFSPDELHFDRHFSTKLATVHLGPPNDTVPLTVQEKITRAAEMMSSKAQQRKNRHERVHAKKTVFAIGDKVLLRALHVSNLQQKETKKFFQLFDGPYIVTSLAGNNAYTLQDIAGKSKGTFNTILLKSYFQS